MASIAAFHVSNKSTVKGKGKVFIDSRTSGGVSGTFQITINVHFDPATEDYPSGSLKITTDLSDTVNGTFNTKNIELINSHGKGNPTVFLTGKIDEDLPNYKGCRYWLMIANNRTNAHHNSADIVSFSINDKNGQLVAYGTGTLAQGDDIRVN